MKIGTYLKRGVKYILYDHKVPSPIYVKPGLIESNSMFKDKVVLITGGGSGIGLSIAKRFVEQDAKVIITGRSEEKLKKAIKDMKNVIYIVNDVQKIHDHDKLLNIIYEKYGHIDILINNAGISKHEKDFFTVTEKDFDDQFNTNLKGAYFLTQNFIKRILKQDNKECNIIFITSERGDQCDYLPYGMTKHALNCLIEGLSCKYIKDGIRINGIAPGVTSSDITEIDKNGNLYSDIHISGRFYTPEEVAEITLFLASDYAKCISGEIIHSNNGNHLNPHFITRR